jgi:hypothetical protein
MKVRNPKGGNLTGAARAEARSGYKVAMAKRRLLRLAVLSLIGLSAAMLTTAAAGGAPPQPAAGSGGAAVSYLRLPLSFEANRGQTDAQVKFLARGPGYTLFLTSQEAVLALGGSAARGPKAAVVRLELRGAEPQARVLGERELGGRSNYFVGNDPRRWQREIPTYGQVRYEGVYPGVDLVYYGRQGELEYDFVVRPGAEARAIGLEVVGAAALRLEASGDLVMATEGGEVRLHRPVAYQRVRERRCPVEARYVLRGKRGVGLQVGEYDRRLPLVIDPVLSYATYLGGSGGDVAYGIAVDSSGDAYITGITNSSDFPTQGAEQTAAGGSGDAFITKLNATGDALVYSTYLGGNGADTANGIVVAAGDAYVVGTTTSTNFPTTQGVFQSTYGGEGDAFIVHLNSTGNALVYSSYLGGHGSDYGQAIALDGAGNAYVTGSTQSTDFPVANALQPTKAGGSDAFVAKVNFSGTQIVYSTYLGGTQADVGQAIKVDSSGNAVVTGYTFSSDFPIENPYQGATAGQPDAFVSKLNADGSALVFSSYLGGSGDDRGLGVALDASGNVYVAGVTQSTDFPTTVGAWQGTNHGGRDAFVSKLGPTGANLLYSTLLGGTGADQASAIAVNSSSGLVTVTGFTQSSDFPTYTPVQAILGISGGSFCGPNPCADAFVTQIAPSGSTLSFSTYLGGSGADFGQAVALDSAGVPYVTGSTASTNFPAIAGAYQASLKGVAGNTFVAKIDPANQPGIAIVPASLSFGNQALSVRSAAQTVSIINAGSAPLTISGITPSGDFLETDDCVGTLSGGGGYCTISVTFTPTELGSATEEISIDDNAPDSPHTITVTGTGVAASTAVTVSPTSLSFGDILVGSVSDSQPVTITNTGTSTLNITDIRTSSNDYVQTNTCGATLNVLNVGESCKVSVSFQPLGSGTRNGVLSISSNASGSPHNVVLSGTGDAVFSLASTTPAKTIVVGSSSTTFSISASAPSNFTGNITLACSSGLTCSFDPSSILPGQSSTLTLSNLSASTTNPLNFKVNGTSGSQTATLPLTLLLSDFSVSASPALQTIVSGGAAEYTVLVTPLYGFDSEVTLSCDNLPAQAKCKFSPSSVTPSGSPASVSLTITTPSGRLRSAEAGCRSCWGF